MVGSICPRAHGDSHVRLHQRGRIIDAVAYHGDRIAATDTQSHHGHLLLRQEVGADLIDAQGLTNGPRKWGAYRR
jgi:hypothetical protein